LRTLRVLEKRAASDEPITFESNADLRCELAGEDTDDPGVWVFRSDWGRANLARAAKLVAAIEGEGCEDTLRALLLSDLGRSNPERACELALEGSKLSAAEVVRDDFDPRDKEYDDFKTREMEREARYW
jgi:hypothetical protein